MGLNYVDPAGTKLGLSVDYSGSFYQDDGVAPGRPLFPATTRVDLFLAREKRVGNEFFLHVSNVFAGRHIVFNGIPIGERTWLLGWTHRE